MSDYSRQKTDGNQHGVPLPAPSANSSGATSSYSSASKGSDSSSSHDDGGYFARHGIIAGPNEDFASLFNRLAIQEGWSKTQRKKHRPEAITAEIDAIYGTDTTKLEKWQELCRDVNIEPVPLSITQCKKALKMVYCNLTNLINHRRNRDIQLILFPNYQSFRTWTLGGKNRSRIFPKQVAKDEGFIKALLRDLRLD